MNRTDCFFEKNLSRPEPKIRQTACDVEFAFVMRAMSLERRPKVVVRVVLGLKCQWLLPCFQLYFEVSPTRLMFLYQVWMLTGHVGS